MAGKVKTRNLVRILQNKDVDRLHQRLVGANRERGSLVEGTKNRSKAHGVALWVYHGFSDGKRG